MHTSTSSTKPTDSPITGKPKGRPERIGSLAGDLGSGTLTDTNARLKKIGERETQFQPPSTVVDRFYTALKAIYGTKFSAQFATPQEVHQSKAMWAREIEGISEKRLRACLQNAKRELMSGNPNYLWPNLGLILGHDSGAWERQCHRVVDTSHLIEDITTREKRLEEGLVNIRALRESTGL